MSYDMGQALEHLAVLTDHIQASALMLQRSFKMFGGSIQTQGEPMQMENLDNINGRENVLSNNGKRKCETDDSEACSSGTQKRLKDKTECPEAIIINDNGISISQNIDKITSEQNRGSVVLSRVQMDKLDDGLLFHGMTKPSITSNTISLSRNYVDEFLRTTGIDLSYGKKTVNTTCNCVCLGP